VSGQYRSALAPHIEALVQEKHACGYSFKFQAYILGMFDSFVADSKYDDGTISRELCDEWSEQRDTEGMGYRSQRVQFVRLLAKYMASIGIECYIPKPPPKGNTPDPYVMSKEELQAFFRAIDSRVSPHLTLERLPMEKSVLFRMYYCCGLRLSEAINLKRENFCLENGAISILQSKGDKDREIYVDPGFLEMCRRYDAKMEEILPGRTWFFPGRDPNEHFEKSGVDYMFKTVWESCAPNGASDKNPTVHSLRHTFVVARMNKWIEEGRDIEQMMPYLSRYLGHADVNGTQYYFHVCMASLGLVRSLDETGGRIVGAGLEQSREIEDEEPPSIGRGSKKGKRAVKTKNSADRVLQGVLSGSKKEGK
jgi:integrase